MPSLGADMEAGTLVEWVKKPGDPVKRGDIIAVVDTQKGAIDVEVYEDGVLARTIVEPGQSVPVGTVLAIIEPAGAPPAVPPPLPAATPAEARRISPAARKAAQQLQVDLAAIAGSGPGGAVTVADVERAAALPQKGKAEAAPAPDRAAGMRAAIAAAMTRSKREIPHFYLAATIDMGAALGWLSSQNEARPVTARILPVALLVRAVARALVDTPELNGFWVNGAFRAGPGIHVGCAISLRGGGLVAPALRDADRKSLDTLMSELRDLVARARAGSLRSSELSDPTITITNLGDTGVEAAFGVIYPPQVALVAFGRIVQRPWVVGDTIQVRPLVTAALSADHRAVDGHRGGLFLSAVDRLLQEPGRL
jgi:pyruvate dehydrogenase E2 component (dihydrolipoamide acetyltransferase)